MRKDMIRLRPHHLLRTQGYSGKGYSDNFVSNMNEVVERLRTNKDEMVEITFSTDNLCACCPSKLSDGVCDSDVKVLHFDKGVVDAIDLKEGTYSYQELISKLDTYLTSGHDDELLRNICGNCNWYPVSACWKNIKTRKYIL